MMGCRYRWLYSKQVRSMEAGLCDPCYTASNWIRAGEANAFEALNGFFKAAGL